MIKRREGILLSKRDVARLFLVLCILCKMLYLFLSHFLKDTRKFLQRLVLYIATVTMHIQEGEVYKFLDLGKSILHSSSLSSLEESSSEELETFLCNFSHLAAISKILRLLDAAP